MLRYELKKVFGRRGNQIALALLACMLALTCALALNVSYVNREGVTETGILAARKLRAEKKAWAGKLDEARIRSAIEENLRNQNTPEARSEEFRDMEIAYSRGQGYGDIRQLCNRAFSGDYQEYDYYLMNRLSPGVAPEFDENRIRLLKNWLADETTGASASLNAAEQAYLVERYEALETPLDYDYFDGWDILLEYLPVMLLLLAIVLGYLLGGIFSNEFIWRTDALFFSSAHGRGRAVWAKLAAGTIIATALYWITALAFSAVILLALGADGAACPIQIDGGFWKSFYNLRFGEAWCVALLGGYIGSLFLAMVTMLISAASRSTVLAVLSSVLLILIPEFLGDADGRFLTRLLGLTPSKLLQMAGVMKQFDLYSIGGRIVGSLWVLPALYGALTLLLPPLIYRNYRRKELV